MQAQLFRKTKKPRVHSPKERRLRIAELLYDEHRKVTKFYSGSSSPTANNKKRASPSDQPKSSTSSPYDVSSNDQEYKPKGLAYRKKNNNKKQCRISPSLQPHAICLNHISAQPYCSIDAKEIFNTYPTYYKRKYKYVLNWLRKNFGRTAKPKPPPLNQDSTSESSDYDDSTSDTDDDTTTTTETETVIDIQIKTQKRRRFVSDSEEESSSESSSDSETTEST